MAKLGKNEKPTFSVGELIEFLGKFDEDMPVLAEWESVFAGFSEQTASVENHFNQKCLVFDVEDYYRTMVSEQ